MSDFVNVTATFSMVISIKDREKLKDAVLRETVRALIFDETEWLGEPKSIKGCVVNMNPKTFSIGDGDTKYEQLDLLPDYKLEGNSGPPPKSVEPSATPEEEFLPLVKAVRRGEEVKLLKKPKQIMEALKTKEGYILVLQPKNGGLKFVDIDQMIGTVVRYVDKNGTMIITEVGKNGTDKG